MAGGMAICIASAVALTRLLTGAPESLIGVMAALAAYGVGLGLYIAPNNSATIGAAPADKSGVAGGLLNLLRVFGTGVGVAAASTALGWGLHAAADAEARTAHAPEATLLSAVGTVLAMLAGFGAIGGAAALIRGKPKRVAEKPEPTPLATPDRGGA
jgi:hypothetical protein